LLVILRGRIELPSRLWLGGFLTGVGLGLLVWLRFGASFGVVAGVIGMTLFGLAGRWFAAVGAAIVGFLVAAIGPAFHLGPLQGVALGAAVAVTAFLLVFILDRLLKVSLPSTMLKFAFLFLVAGIVAYKTGEPWFCKLCPQGTFEAGIPLVVWDPVNALRGLVGWLYWVKIGILLLVVVAAIAIKRPFCRLICPIGAVYSIFNKGSMLHMTFDSSACTDCKICRRICPTDIDPTQNANQLECIRCFECSWNCPKSGLKIKV
jgi:ferredoxin